MIVSIFPTQLRVTNRIHSIVWSLGSLFTFVIPAKAGIQTAAESDKATWTPAFAGVTVLQMSRSVGDTTLAQLSMDFYVSIINKSMVDSLWIVRRIFPL